jgi:DNA-binding GntR family transcriptional regulator
MKQVEPASSGLGVREADKVRPARPRGKPASDAALAEDRPSPQVAEEASLGVTAPLGGLSRHAAHMPPGQARRSKADEAYAAIRNAILDGTLAPGAALDKPAICKELKLSRFPVTAAIARLAFEQLVDVEPQRGSFVSRIAARDARELMLVRRGIEVEVAGEAANRLDGEAIALLSRILRYQQAAMEARDFQDFHRLDHAFHDQIIASLGFPRAGEILESIRTRVERVRRILLPVPGRISRTFEEHRAIFAAIEAHDEEAARHAMREHIARVLDEFEMLSRDRPDLFAP